jgi:hypothetical protein
VNERANVTEEATRLAGTVRDAFGEDVYRLAMRRALESLRITPLDVDGSWPGSVLEARLYVELRRFCSVTDRSNKPVLCDNDQRL